MSTKFDDYQKVLANQRFHRQAQTAMMAAQTALALDMSGSLRGIQAQMAQVRQMHAEGLAAQQEMLRMEQFQLGIEEFIYKTDKMIEAYSGADCDLAPSARYFNLRGVKDTVEQFGLGTPLIRGRENKAAFETAMESVDGLLGQLKMNSEVIEALKWVKAEQKRRAEEERTNNEKRGELTQKIMALQSKRLNPRFADACQAGLSVYVNSKPPFNDLSFLNPFPALHKPCRLFTLFIFTLPPVGWLFGLLFLPQIFRVGKIVAGAELNRQLDSQIAALDRERSAI